LIFINKVLIFGPGQLQHLLIMIEVNFSEFRARLKKHLDDVENNNETLIIRRKEDRGVAILSMDDYNSIMETVHLLSSIRNTNRLYESINQLKNNQTVQGNLIDE